MSKNDKDGIPPVVNFSQADLDAATKKAVDDARAQASAEFAHQSKCASLIAKWKTQGKLIPAMTPGLSEFMASLDSSDDSTFCFSESDGGKEVTITPFDFVCGLIGAMPNNFASLTADFTDSHEELDDDGKASDFSAPEGHTASSESVALDKKAKNFMAKNPNTTYIQAVQAVS